MFLKLLYAIILLIYWMSVQCDARRKFLLYIVKTMSQYTYSYVCVANPVPPNSSKDPLVEDHGKSTKDACIPKAVFKVNCYNCWCNRIGSMAICKKARKCINPEAPVFIMYPEST